jgi:hypothetical protein
MIDLPTKAEVDCLDGVAGRSTYVIGNPATQQVTHVVVKSYRPPFREYLVPVDQVEDTTPDRIKLKCTRDDLLKMEPFEVEQYVHEKFPEYISSQAAYQTPGMIIRTEVDTTLEVKHQNIPPGEMALRRGAQVEATDGPVGQVDELLINSNNQQVTHLILLQGNPLKNR